MLRSGFLPHFGLLKGLTGSTWAIDGSGRVYNTPTLGSELLTNGGFGSAGSWTTIGSGWSIGSGVATSTATAGATLLQSAVASANNWYAATLDVITYTGGILYHSAAGLFGSSIQLGNSGTQIVTGRSAGADFRIVTNGAVGWQGTIDNASLKLLSLSTLLATTQGTVNQTPLAKVYALATNTQAGVIGWLDNPANPQNFVIAVRNGSGSVNLTKCVAGTYTNLISISSTFVQDAAIEIRRPAGNTFQLWYNGSQVGTDQTINDTAIADNTTPYYGLFSTYSGNTFSEFSLGGNVIPFGF